MPLHVSFYVKLTIFFTDKTTKFDLKLMAYFEISLKTNMRSRRVVFEILLMSAVQKVFSKVILLLKSFAWKRN